MAPPIRYFLSELHRLLQSDHQQWGSLRKIKMTMSTICSRIRGQQQRQQRRRQQWQQHLLMPFVSVTIPTIGSFATNWREIEEEREIWMISSWWSIDFLHETNQPKTMSTNQGCLSSEHSLSASGKVDINCSVCFRFRFSKMSHFLRGF